MLTLETGKGPLAQFGDLPLRGYQLEPLSVTSGLEKDAGEAGHLVAELAVADVGNPDSSTLPLPLWVKLQAIYNRLLSSCGRLAVRGKKGIEEPRFEVMIPAMAGSVKIRVQAETQQQTNLMGDFRHVDALVLLDELISKVDDPVGTISWLRQQRGHLPAAYLELLKVLTQNQLHFYHEWVDPLSRSHGAGRLNHDRSNPLYLHLSKEEIAEGYESVVVGTLEQIDLKSGTWRLFDEVESIRVSGTGATREIAQGLVMDHNYRFNCQVTLHEDPVTGRSSEKFELTEVLSTDES